MRSRLFAALLLATTGSTGAHALPIHPKPEQILKQAEKPQPYYPPARAGWNGPETADQARNPLLDKIRMQSSPQAARVEILQLLKPDWMALLGFGGLIMLLRALRTRNEAREVSRGNLLPMPM